VTVVCEKLNETRQAVDAYASALYFRLDLKLQEKLSFVRGKHRPARGRCVATVALRLTPMTLKLEGDLDILKMYLHTENEAASLRHSKLRA